MQRVRVAPIDTSQGALGVHGIAMLIAAMGAAVMSVGTQMQSSGARATESNVDEAGHGGFSLKQLTQLLRRKRWVFGTLFLGFAIVFQLVALSMAPLIVVQPIGALALVITTFLNAWVARVQLNLKTLWGVALCTGGIGLFVSVAAVVAVDNPVSDGKVITVLVVLAIVLAGAGLVTFKLHAKMTALVFVLGAGILYGFVATLAKIVLARIMQGDFEWLTVLCVVGLVLASLLGGWFVQDAHASGPPDLVIAGLTVIDPLVAVTIGVVILGEAKHADWFIILLFAVSAIIALVGVIFVSKFHPQSGVAGLTVIDLNAVPEPDSRREP